MTVGGNRGGWRVLAMVGSNDGEMLQQMVGAAWESVVEKYFAYFCANSYFLCIFAVV